MSQQKESNRGMNANLEKRILLIKKYNKEFENPKSGRKKLFSMSSLLKTSAVTPTRSVSISSCGQFYNNNRNSDDSIRMAARVTHSFKETSCSYNKMISNENLFDNNVVISYVYDKKKMFRNCAKLVIKDDSSSIFIKRHSRSYIW